MCRYPWKPGEDIKSPETRLVDGGGQNQIWILWNSGPWEDQQVVLPADPSLQSPIFKKRWIQPSKSNITMGLEKWLSG